MRKSAKNTGKIRVFRGSDVRGAVVLDPGYTSALASTGGSGKAGKYRTLRQKTELDEKASTFPNRWNENQMYVIR